ncbi:MAG: lysine--tRNA ligase [Methanotrichaceae archaeon]
MSIHWADVVAGHLADRGPQTVATGITPSGQIHVGNMREVMTADAVYRALLDRNVDARLIYIADTFDPLRRLYPFLPESFEEHVGKPLSEIPCPEGCCDSYADHFLIPFLDNLDKLGIKPKIQRADQMYKEGLFVESIKTALQRRDDIARILKEVSGRDLPADWCPFDAICQQCGRLNTTKVTGFNIEKETVDYVCECGHQGTTNMKGGGKLAWRIDWPARWSVLKVTMEPFGKDHATVGGSYDTGTRISKEIYGYEPPYPVVYEWIHLKGKGAMHSSTGVVITIKEMLDVVPPEVLRYLIIRSKPEKHIAFDPGLSLLTLVEEYDRRAGDERAFDLSVIGSERLFSIPYKHMVNVVQIARGDKNTLLKILGRGGYDISDKEEIFSRAANAEVWLERYAPSFVKFQLQEEVPPAVNNLSPEARKALHLLADRIENKSAEEIHSEVYAVAEETGISSKKLFQAIYTAFLGQKQGPKAGWFLSSLDRDFVKKRLLESGST